MTSLNWGSAPPLFYKQATEAEKGAVIAPGASPPISTSLSSPWALRKPEDPDSLIYSVPPALYPKPRLGAQPAAVVTPGVNVTLRCRAPLPAWRFELFKSGEIESILQRDVFLELAEFFLEEVTTEQGGSYRCCYKKPGWRPGVCSQLSDALELLVTGEVLWVGEKGHRSGMREEGGERERDIQRQACTTTHRKKSYMERERENPRETGVILNQGQLCPPADRSKSESCV